MINKPAGITSHDVVDVIRRRFNVKRVGHAGTLDPMATGVLIILMGKATKLSIMFMRSDKEYRATLFLGKRTDSQDSTGRVIEEKPLNGLDRGSIKRAFRSFIGEIEQIPPMISAKQYKGRRLYKLAREGKFIPRKPCRVRIDDIELLDLNIPEVTFRVRCSKGTYIRTLCEDIGRALGYPAHMTGLVRTASGGFSLEQARDLGTVSETDIQST